MGLAFYSRPWPVLFAYGDRDASLVLGFDLVGWGNVGLQHSLQQQLQLVTSYAKIPAVGIGPPT